MFRPAEVKPITPLISTTFNQIKNKIDEFDLNSNAIFTRSTAIPELLLVKKIKYRL